MVFEDGYYYQDMLFYSSRWSKEMEHTFVHALLQQKRDGHFSNNGVNCHAILYALYDVDKEHGRRLPYSFARNKVKKLHERYKVFSWIINRTDVFCNHHECYVVAEDHVWEVICKARVIGKCYVNAYEDKFEELCILFAPDIVSEYMLEADAYIHPMNAFALVPPWMDEAPNPDLDQIIMANMDYVSHSPADSTSLWRFLEQYYASEDDDDCQSILALPGVPPPMQMITQIIAASPAASYVTIEHPSSSASNDIPNPYKVVAWFRLRC